MKIKVLVGIFSRANHGRLQGVLKTFVEDDRFELQVMLGASYYDKNVEYLADSRINCLIADDTHSSMAITTVIALINIPGELERLKPDIVLIHGDRYELLSLAIAASYMNIPIAHTEGGEFTGCIDDKVRNAITALADCHFVATDEADWFITHRSNSADFDVFKVGSTALDLLDSKPIKKWNQVLILQHSDTTNKEDITPLLDAIEEILYCRNVIWINPNVDAGNKEILRKFHNLDDRICFKKDLTPNEYIKLMKESICIIGNTSSGIKEGSYLGIPYVCVGSRQKGREHDKNTIMVKMDKKEIIEGFNTMIKKDILPSNYFGEGNASKMIADILFERMNKL